MGTKRLKDKNLILDTATQLETSSSSANWTPNISFATPGTFAVSGAGYAGSYTKVGRLVTIRYQITVSTLTKNGASGNLLIGNLPFPADTGFGGIGPGVWGGQTETFSGFTGLSGLIKPPVATGQVGSTQFFLQYLTLTAGGTILASNLTDGGSFGISGSGFYYTSA